MKKLMSLLLALCLCAALMVPATAEDKGAYVLMNIPYADFYAAESDVAVDAVTSSTLMKPRAGALAGGSYHVDPEGSDISGVIFPVYVEDVSALASLGGVEITDDSSVEITVTLKGEEQTATYAGKDALFEAPSYSWYALGEQPTVYKTLTMGDAPAFSAIEGEAKAIEAGASIVYDRHADIVIKVDGLDGVLGEDTPVSGIVLVADDGTKVGLAHLANFWRRAEIGMRLDDAVYAALKGKRIDRIEYITTGGLYAIDVDIPVIEDARLIALSATYVELFPEFAREDLKDYWMACIKAWNVDDEAAEGYYQMLTQTYMGRLYGEEAMNAYGASPETMQFDCFFENGLAKLTVAGGVISGMDAEGNELFRHTYAFDRDMTVTYFGQEMPGYLHVYKTEDADAGLFTYFAFSDDNLAETQHIEFRYGDTLEDLNNYSEGKYAYWLASGILDGYKDSLIQDCIKLFVDENVGEAQGEAAEAETEAKADAIEISTAEQLAAIKDNLSGNYVLTADIDLAGAEWTPIGAYAPSGESAEEQEIPAVETAFTGTFDGQGHTISNLVINQPEAWAQGLFGCIANTKIGNFTLENATVDAQLMGSDVVGYAYMSTVSGVNLVNGKVTAHAGEMSAEGMYGGIVGAGMGSMVENCTAQADVVIPDGTANAGIVGGGLEMTSVVGCKATGTVTAGNDCYGLGGVSGCGFAAEQFTDCAAENVTITAGDNCFWIGGVTGYAGGYPDAQYGMPVTVFTNCTAKNVTVSAGENADGIGDIVGAGFYNEQVAQSMGAPFDQPTQFELVDCVADSDGTEADDAAVAAQLLEDVKGTYEPLFPVITDPAYDQIWLDHCAAVVGDEMAPEVAQTLKDACNGTIYGQEAIDAYGDGSNGAQFDCLFVGGVDQITFDGATISGTLAGEAVFSHEYAYVSPLSLGGMMNGWLYETADADAGEFKYFFMMPDTPASTYHLEFRYGSDVDALTEYATGPYAYWLAAGFPVDADEVMTENVIGLFCDENLAEMADEKPAA